MLKRTNVFYAMALLCMMAVLWTGCSRKVAYTNEEEDVSDNYSANETIYDNDYYYGAAEPDSEHHYDNIGAMSTRLIRVARAAPPRGSIGERIPIEIELTALEDVGDVIITDALSSHATVIKTEPEAIITDDNEIIWNIDAMDAGQTQTLRAWVKTDQVGDLVDCVTVDASPRLVVATYIGKCHLRIAEFGPDVLSLGDSANYNIEISNRAGSSPARDVVVTALVPEGMEHVTGEREISWKIGDLEVGEFQSLTFCLKGILRGGNNVVVSAKASNAPEDRTQVATNIVNAAIGVHVSGSRSQFIYKEANFDVVVTNHGDTELKDVVVRNDVTPNTRIVGAGGAQVENNNMRWFIASLQPGETKTFPITLVADSPTRCDNLAYAWGACKVCGGVEDEDECNTEWRGVPGLLVEMIDTCDPLLVGETGYYRVRITNQGTAADKNIQITANFPRQLEPTEATGSTEGAIAGQSVSFAAYPKLAPGESVEYTIEAKAVVAGDARVKMELHSDHLQQPVMEEESTYVY